MKIHTLILLSKNFFFHQMDKRILVHKETSKLDEQCDNQVELVILEVNSMSLKMLSNTCFHMWDKAIHDKNKQGLFVIMN